MVVLEGGNVSERQRQVQTNMRRRRNARRSPVRQSPAATAETVNGKHTAIWRARRLGSRGRAP